MVRLARSARGSSAGRRARARQRVVVAGMGDTGLPIAVRFARRCDVVGISTRPALVSGQELGTRLVDPPRWRASYLVPFSRFRRLDRVRLVHGRIASVDLERRQVQVEDASGSTTVEHYDWLVLATGASNGFWRHDRVEHLDEVLDGHDDVARLIASAATVAVVGGGPSGVSVADNLARTGSHEVHLFHSGELPLPGYHPRARQWVAERLRRDGVVVHPNHRARFADDFTGDQVTSGAIEWATGQEPFEADAIIWAVGRVRPHSGFCRRRCSTPTGSCGSTDTCGSPVIPRCSRWGTSPRRTPTAARPATSAPASWWRTCGASWPAAAGSCGPSRRLSTGGARCSASRTTAWSSCRPTGSVCGCRVGWPRRCCCGCSSGRISTARCDARTASLRSRAADRADARTRPLGDHGRLGEVELEERVAVHGPRGAVARGHLEFTGRRSNLAFVLRLCELEARRRVHLHRVRCLVDQVGIGVGLAERHLRRVECRVGEVQVRSEGDRGQLNAEDPRSEVGPVVRVR